MAKFTKKKSGDLPAVNTASLPDIVFMLLFFFMVATTMRETTLKIQNPKLPTANQIEKLDKKDLIMYIYAGKPSQRYQSTYGTEAKIQLNDKLADVNDIPGFIYEERATKREELLPLLTTALKVDGDTNMGLVSDIKQKLRDVDALKLNYVTKNGNAVEANN